MRRYAIAVVVAGVLALAGCGRSGAPPAADPNAAAPGAATASTPPPDGAFNATDVMFLQMMLPHHGQGLEIVRLAATKATRSDIRTLAAAIDATQTDEAEKMSGWLRDWGQPATADANAHAAHGGMPSTSAAEMARLESATGVDFERTFLNMMIAHQDDAIQLARLELGGGVHPQARALADRIQQSRAAQITQMLGYLHP